MTHRPETISLAQNISFLGPSTERIEKVAQNFLEGNDDPDFEVEVLDVSAADHDYDSDSDHDYDSERLCEWVMQATAQMNTPENRLICFL